MAATSQREFHGGDDASGRAAPDGDIVRLFRDGDEDEAARRLLERYGGRVRAALRKRFPSIHDDHILLQAIHDAMRTVLVDYDPSKGASLGGWLMLIACRRVCDVLRGDRARRHRTTSLVGDDCCDQRPAPGSHLATEEFRAAVRLAMEQLSGLERAVIEADIDAGKQASADSLAKTLKTTEQSIYAARARARRKLLESPVLKRAV
jgi:RNA polymerase sigma factor (sigma-70 family)